MCKQPNIQVDVSGMDKDALLKMFETEWQDHFQTRGQTWQALQIAALLTAAIVGIQWKVSHPLVGIFSSILLIGVSMFGMQITFRHRNSTEITKFTVISEIEKRLGFKSPQLGIPRRIRILDIFKFGSSNTTLFLLRMQMIIFLLGVIMLLVSLFQAIQGNKSI